MHNSNTLWVSLPPTSQPLCKEQESDSTHTLADRAEKFFVFPFSGQIDVNCFRDIRLIGGMNLNLNLLLKYK